MSSRPKSKKHFNKQQQQQYEIEAEAEAETDELLITKHKSDNNSKHQKKHNSSNERIAKVESTTTTMERNEETKGEEEQAQQETVEKPVDDIRGASLSKDEVEYFKRIKDVLELNQFETTEGLRICSFDLNHNYNQSQSQPNSLHFIISIRMQSLIQP